VCNFFDVLGNPAAVEIITKVVGTAFAWTAIVVDSWSAPGFTFTRPQHYFDKINKIPLVRWGKFITFLRAKIPTSDGDVAIFTKVGILSSSLQDPNGGAVIWKAVAFFTIDKQIHHGHSFP
jgi:hypothetical protein